ncbi:MAG: hypothetical protein KBE16_00470 [Alphaproteobacteria bacterium]|nr:hypothetical protein [Alphaproteobacteria bacterium]
MKNILFLLILLTGFFASSAVQTQLANKVIVGTASSSDKTVEFNDGAGTANPKIKLNSTTSVLQTSINGVDFRNLNIYSGIGETNLLDNNGFEVYREFGPSAGFYGWLRSGGNTEVATGSNAITDSRSIRFNGTAGNYLYSLQYTVPKRIYGKECLSKINYTTGAFGASAKVYMEVYDGGGALVAGGASYVTVSTSTPLELKLNFTCPSSGTIGMRLTAVGSTLYHYFDDAFLGEAATAKSPTSPTIQKFTSGSGTYTTPLNVKYIKVKMVGPGGGGAGSSTQAADNYGAGGAGSGATTFGTALLSAGAGGGAGGPGSGAGGTGGSASISAPAFGTSINGGSGSNGVPSSVQFPGGVGAVSLFGGAGKAGAYNVGAGGSAVVNSGSGGGGAGSPASGAAGGSGGAGGYVEAFIAGTLSSSYSYSVGSGGTGGTAGTSGAAGGAGASGIIIVEEYYQ